MKDTGIDLPVFAESVADASLTSLRSRAKFGGYSVSQEECERLVEFVKLNGVRTVLEFGPGASTWYLAAAGCEVWSVESDRKWYEHYRQEFADVPNVHVIHYDADGELTIPETDGRRFDMAFVDAPPGHYYRKYARINSALYAARHSDTWILHDTRREAEQNTVSVFEDLGWSVESIPARAGLAVFTRKRVGDGTPPSANTVRQEIRPPNSETPSTPSERECPRAYDFFHWNTLPKVSCQCITYGRPRLLNEAVESFLRQDYPGESELVILNDHAEITIRNPGIDHVTTINVQQRIRSVGEKRNACCGFCTGSVILPWDDDDISLPWRISLTVQNMTNLAYYKPDRLWYWSNGRMTLKQAVAHAMGGWSRSPFDEAGGYPPIESGQDQGLEDRFQASGQRDVRPLDARDVFYIYRFPGTGSYHLSAHGFGTGMDKAERFVRENVRPGEYELVPEWHADYTGLAAAAAETEQPIVAEH